MTAGAGDERRPPEVDRPAAAEVRRAARSIVAATLDQVRTFSRDGVGDGDDDGDGGAIVHDGTGQTEVGRGAIPRGGIVGHGVDLIPLARVAAVLDRHEQAFADRCFTPEEQAWADAGGALRTQRYAGRFAAKEAIAKALGTGFSAGIGWTDVAILPEPGGAPGVHLSGAAADRAKGLGITRWAISITHAGGIALASAIAVGDPPATV